MTWNLEQALKLCTAIESICPEFGCHIALTGGLLYKNGERKDCDILFYRIRQVPEIDIDGLFDALEVLGLIIVKDHGWCAKMLFEGRAIDAFFPERPADPKFDYNLKSEHA